MVGAPEGWEGGKTISPVGMSWSVVGRSSVDSRESRKMEMTGAGMLSVRKCSETLGISCLSKQWNSGHLEW